MRKKGKVSSCLHRPSLGSGEVFRCPVVSLWIRRRKITNLSFGVCKGTTKKQAIDAFFSVYAQTLHEAYFQEPWGQNFILPLCLFKFLLAKNASMLLAVFHSLNLIKGNVILCVTFCHFQLHLFLKCPTQFSLTELFYFSSLKVHCCL